MFKPTRLVGVVACLLTVGALAAGSAFAGEYTGNGKPTQGPANANSPCVYSGLEDNEDQTEGPVVPGVTQNWGQIVSAAGGGLGGANYQFVPEINDYWGCNAHQFPLK